MNTTIRLGTRGSPLAFWQARHVEGLILAKNPGVRTELIEIETRGDIVLDKSLSQIGGDGLFTKEIQKALLDHRVDVAVHSLKDLPTEPVAGLTLASVPERGPRGDALLSSRYQHFEELPEGARIGTGSIRRRAQLLHRRPDLQIFNLRGNVATRIQKLDSEEFDAIILAEAGLVRLGLEHLIKGIIDLAWMLPTIGQGALGLECREEDGETRSILETINDPGEYMATRAERAFLRSLGGGCLVPVGAWTIIQEEQLSLQGVLLGPDGNKRIEGAIDGPLPSAEKLGDELAQRFLARGGAEILRTG